MKKCKPCIRISLILKLAKHHFKAFAADVKRSNEVTKMSCEISYQKGDLKIVDPYTKRKVDEVRKAAEEAFDPDSSYFKYEDLDKDFDEFCDEMKERTSMRVNTNHIIHFKEDK